jgi:hypothetical protein
MKIIRNNASNYGSLDIWSWSEGWIKIEHDYVQDFLATGKIYELVEKYHVDTNIVLHVIQVVAEQIKAHKKWWFVYGKPAEKGPPSER